MSEEEGDGSERGREKSPIRCFEEAPASLINSQPLTSGTDFQEVLSSLKVGPQTGRCKIGTRNIDDQFGEARA